MSDFKWNTKKNVQYMTSNRQIQTVSLSPKEVVCAGGNRIQHDQVIASLCAVVQELMEINEQSQARINSLLSKGTDHHVEREPVSKAEEGQENRTSAT